jgi:segregation and condensation protein B
MEPAAITENQGAIANGGSQDEALVTSTSMTIDDPDTSQHMRMLEALLFAASEAVDLETLTQRLPNGIDVLVLLDVLKNEYANRGVNVICVGGKWTLRTAPDLNFLMERERIEPRRLSRAGVETLAIIAYHQPVTRAEIEEIRGVVVSKGTVDLLMEAGWVRLRGRRRTPGRPVTYGTTEEFLSHFGLENVGDLPGVDELKASGLLDARLPPGFAIPIPKLPNVGADEDEANLGLEDDNPEFQIDFLEGAGDEEK